MSARKWVWLVLVLLLVLAAVMFHVQNGLRTTDLSLDVGFFAFHLKKPVSVPILLWVTLGIGLAGGGGWGAVAWMSVSRRARDLEHRMARASVREGADDWS